MKRSLCDRPLPTDRRGPGRRGLVTGAIAMLLAGGGAAAQEPPADAVPASECCQYALLSPIGARALALGNAVTARTMPGGLFVNPAALAGVGDDEFVVHNASTALEDVNTFALILNAGLVGTFALSYRLIDHGEQQATDDFGNPTGTLGVLEHVLTATYATRVMAGLEAGVSYKLYQFRQDCRGFCNTETFVGTTHGLDVGVHYQPSQVPALDVGASVVQLGFALQVINAEQASPLPTRLRAGASYEVLHHFSADSTVTVHVMADVVSALRASEGTLLNVGAEAALDETIFLRAGYAGGSGLNSGAAVGIGLRYDRFDLGVAKGFVNSLADDSEPTQITFGVRF